MSNLYIWVDDKNRNNLIRTIDSLARRHPDFKALLRDGDKIENTLNLLFPHGMPMEYLVSNLSIDDRPEENLDLAFRPVIGPGQPWPFPPGCSLVAKGRWKTGAPFFRIQDIFEVADAPAQTYEKSLTVVVYQDNPSLQPRINKTDNALSRELAHVLPPISANTRNKLVDWRDFLGWKRKLVSEKTRGLHFTKRGWQEDKLVFQVIGENKEYIRSVLNTLSRQDVMAFDSAVSEDEWLFRISDKGNTRRTPKGIELGQPEARLTIVPDRPKPQDCPWPTPCLVDVVVSLSEDDQNQLSTAEDPESIREGLLTRIPKKGFLSVSAAGDLALIRRHEQALNRLQDQGGYAPYLSSYLFDARQAKKPTAFEPITEWFRDDLNTFQQEAVNKILSAPDLCLIQGPPGTGKTTVIAEAIMQLARKGERVLLASQAHTAVDNALERLGRHPDLRVIRLARDLNKISGEGNAFVQEAALSRYYSSLAEDVEKRFLTPWRDEKDRLNQLQAWLNQAEFLHRDAELARQALTAHENALKQAELNRVQAWQKLQEQAQKNADAEQQKNRLLTLKAFLEQDEETIPEHCPLPEPAASALASALFRLADAEVKLPISVIEWTAVPAQQPQMLSGLLRFWHRLWAHRADLDNDVARLRAAGPSALQSPDRAIRLAELEAEERALANKLDDDASLLPQWKTKRREIKQLRDSSSAGLNPALYGEMFLDPEYWCQSIENAELAGEKLAARVAALVAIGTLIEQELARLLAQTDKLIALSHVPDIDESEWRQREQETDQLRQREPRIRQALEDSVSQQAKWLATRISPTISPESPSTEISMRFAQEMASCVDAIGSLTSRIAEQQAVQEIWEPLLQDWRNDLRRPTSSQNDWPHFKETFVAECNLVAITCNEREQTLEESGQVSFDVAIIDEVSKATPLEMLLPLMRARRSVLVGDHRQLPPLFQEGADTKTFSDAVDETDEDGQDSRTSLTRHNLQRFDKMVTASLFKSHFETADDSIKARLEIQFRMHPQIMAMVNHFYERRLSCGLASPHYDRNHGLQLVDTDGNTIVNPARNSAGVRVVKNTQRSSSAIPPEEKEVTEGDHVLWVDTSRDLRGQLHREDVGADGKPARSNRLEAQLIAHTLSQIDKQCADLGYSAQKRYQVGVVSFYARQCRLIREAIREIQPNGRFDCLDIEINTVIRYQGKEKPTILVSLVRNDGVDTQSHGGRVRRRSSRANVARYEFINVAFSRAQELLIVFGARNMYESYDVTLPHMDSEGVTTRTVYKDILDQLDRDARLIPASRLMREVPQSKRKSPPSPGMRHRGSK
ncbi:DEAD/DEAH box helicase [Pectobacterium jejuense]|uniref:DEAD/DEAH box helicase n=1 Tax=Pectobacterium jejuense TaxID=2974022 RepID=UPI003819B92A